MTNAPSNVPRLIAIALIALALLAAMVWATGGGFEAGPPPTPQPTALPTPTVNPVRVVGSVSGAAYHLSGHTWRFTYTVRDTGRVPIAGFQLNGPAANLGKIQGKMGWLAFGSGVCKQNYPGILVYWSINSASPSVIRPGRTGTFSFVAATNGTAQDGFSLSWGNAGPLFGKVIGPAQSTLPAPAPCK